MVDDDLVQGLMRAEAYPHPVDEVTHLQTHISHLFLAGRYAYKIKKSVNLGFLDFSTLERRKFFCEEEIRLNGRLADGIYLQVAPVLSRQGELQICLDGEESWEIVEYAVRMERFPHAMELSQLLVRDSPSPLWKDEWLDRLSIRVARFHHQAAIAGAETEYGEPIEILHPIEENYRQLEQNLQDRELLNLSQQIYQWSLQQWQQLQGLFRSRRSQGMIRECHGDMHLGNMVYWKGEIQVFDGIEFNPELRWIDPISEIAFLLMDLQSRGLEDLGWRFLNGYLSWSGDYQGLELLNFYRCYRAVVRAKVASFRCGQQLSQQERRETQQEITHYLQLAEQSTHSTDSSVITLFGLSGSGKSTIAARLAERIGAVWIRSDLERKRLFGKIPGGVRPPLEGEIYGRSATEATYRKLEELATLLVRSGFSVIIDATFLERERRQHFYRSFHRQEVPFQILALSAEEQELRRRIRLRSAQSESISDADEGVLEQQIQKVEPIVREEEHYTLHLQSGRPPDYDWLAAEMRRRLNLG